MNKKGEIVNNIMVILIFFFVIIIGIAFFWGVATVAPLVVGEGFSLANTVKDSVNNSGDADLYNATVTASNVGTNALGLVQFMIYMCFIGYIIGFLILAYYVRTYKFLMFFWIFIIIATTFISLIVSNAYEQASTNPLTSQYYTDFSTVNFLMLHLPQIVLAMGILTGIILFVLMSRDPEEETQAI